MTVLVTGANGFVGSALCARLLRDGGSVRAAVRSLNSQSGGAEAFVIRSLSSDTDWTEVLSKVEQVVHLAARVHVMNNKNPYPLAVFRRVTVDATANLARQAATAGVGRFIFLSSIKVNGEFTEAAKLFTTDDASSP